jgi:Helix-turn-helix domain
MEPAKRLLLTSTHTVAEIAWSIGYENISHFRRVFALHTGGDAGHNPPRCQHPAPHISARIDLPHGANRSTIMVWDV